MLKQCEWTSSFPSSSRLGRHREGKQGANTILSGAASFLWCRRLGKGLPLLPPEAHLIYSLLLVCFRGPTAPPAPRKPPFWLQKLFRRPWEESRTGALSVHSANRLSEMKVLGASLSTVPWPPYFPLRESHSDALRRGEEHSLQVSLLPPTQDQPPQSFRASNSLLSCYELLFKKHL